MLLVRRVLPFLLVPLLANCASTEDPAPRTSRTSAAVKGGSPDSTSTAVVAVVLSRPTNAGVGFCTGTLIAPNLVLTARHCVSDIEENSLPGAQCTERTSDGGTVTPPDKN